MLDWELTQRSVLAEAARTARIMREQLAAGDDPLEIKKAESEKVAIPTFADAARRVHAETVSWMGKSKACKAVVIDA
ncbi:integrase [Escherichia coli]|uniref:Integrase n=1 Tax=Escherichia coli TaxID=562 RepID=A0A376RMC1_ECOLX|nr:integrase [Escherichia coli]